MNDLEQPSRRDFLDASLVAAAGFAHAFLPAETLPATSNVQEPQVKLGPGASLAGKRVFPPDNPWNQDISAAPVDPNSDALVASIGLDRHLHPDFGTVYQGVPSGIPYVVVAGDQPDRKSVV